MAVNKIMCFCGNGLGSSFILEINVKKVLKKHDISGVEVFHTTLDDLTPGAADVFVCGSDLQEKAEKCGPTVGLDNMASVPELEQKLMPYFA